MTELPTVSGGSGPRFLRHVGVAAIWVPVDPDDEGVIDLGVLFNREEYQGASFLIARVDLDAGDAPETAATRAEGLGIRSIIAPGFERAFYEQCFARGLLPVILDEGVVERLADRITEDPGAEVTVDLEAQTVECSDMEIIAFETDPRMRNKLLLGLTDLDEAARHGDDLKALRSADRKRRPWVYDWR